MPIVISQLLSALFLYLTFTASTATMLVVWQTLAGFFFLSIFSAFWALPMNTVPRSLMGVAGGFINMAGQAAAFVSPLLVGYLVGAAGGNFDHGFMFLIASLLVSCTIALTLSGKTQRHQVAHGSSGP
jgi:MFS-type transporter involved in bile tolerance (Atg22 family)